MLITDKGVMIRFGVENVSQTGRATLGVHLIRLDQDAKVATMAVVEKEAPADESDETDSDESTDDGDTSLDRLVDRATDDDADSSADSDSDDSDNE